MCPLRAIAFCDARTHMQVGKSSRLCMEVPILDPFNFGRMPNEVIVYDMVQLYDETREL